MNPKPKAREGLAHPLAHETAGSRRPLVMEGLDRLTRDGSADEAMLAELIGSASGFRVRSSKTRRPRPSTRNSERRA
ncbi:hypothetical protein GGR33_003477 [Methylobacterium brachythecii]|uniref:Resolvase/invertase-type recombinase catalytic domain-containing protein n=1 Tax=Methylobacterium brachythecii TaxID=1176177 RepID=A0A7W6F806_9HYPH|nr:hypothetical protein [Methylobacterium brachythecii]